MLANPKVIFSTVVNWNGRVESYCSLLGIGTNPKSFVPPLRCLPTSNSELCITVVGTVASLDERVVAAPPSVGVLMTV